jgi:hypothetical protein
VSARGLLGVMVLLGEMVSVFPVKTDVMAKTRKSFRGHRAGTAASLLKLSLSRLAHLRSLLRLILLLQR